MNVMMIVIVMMIVQYDCYDDVMMIDMMML